MALAAALIYWLIISLWLAVLATVGVAYVRNPRTFGAVRLLLAVLVIDTIRNIAENLYFGLYFGGQYGLFSVSIVEVLGDPRLLIIPKIVNVTAACAVLVLIAFRWLPLASRERQEAEAELKQATDALSKESEERRRLFETSLDLILVTDRRGVFTQVSPSSLATIGYRPEDMIGRTGRNFIFADDLDSTRLEMKLARQGRQTRNFQCRYTHKNGRVVPLAWSGVWSEPEQRHFFVGRDMTEQKAAEETLWRLAHFDQLTGLPNRTSLTADLNAMLDESAAIGSKHAIAIIGLDGFKDINDTLGHSIGGRLLREAAERIVAADDSCRSYRLGGDQFVLLMRNCGNPITGNAIAEEKLNKLASRFEIDGHELFAAASVGLAIAPADGSDADTLLANADLALHSAKGAGGRRIRNFVPTLRAKAESRRVLDNELRRAWINKEFVLYFQPQVRSDDAAIVGAEALLRWQHPTRGVIAPAIFIEALAESAISLEVGRWILASACRSAVSWREKTLGNLRVAVNLFAVHFRQGTLLQDVKDALQDSGLPPQALELEITENIALFQDEALLSPLRELRTMGVSIAFDDFGTGYASLSCLTSYPLTRIKIDRSFVQNACANSAPKDSAIVRSIMALARNLNLDVTAEGVETIAQATFLRLENCQELQGYLFSKPLPAEAFEELLSHREGYARIA
ncbi:EAL domain-containing protein [Bradyrhizobium sp. 190]|uniref:putative bifunctional diguanylate cyclase/phosphodiesterase n=1 Tax=Bradyrhizobium sp. 190 TaxID=2782658 RepID=UPI001FF90AFC|nr:EAL domain-containing protein [Bradyrhizobium sp. 190]MCK1513909.1 EAL domain-containing protein [Bradyrhizobium sp. 190]